VHELKPGGFKLWVNCIHLDPAPLTHTAPPSPQPLANNDVFFVDFTLDYNSLPLKLAANPGLYSAH
jgi:hypothetical protein